MAVAIEKELEETQAKWQQTQQQLDQTKSELHDVREELERSQSQLDEVLGELEQTHFELHQLKEKGEQKQSESDGKVKQELEETKSKLQKSEELLEESQSQLKETMATLEESFCQLESNRKELEQTKFELKQVQQTAKTQPSSFQLTSEKLAQTKSQVNQMVTGLNQLLEPLQLKLELSPDKAQTPVDIKHSFTQPPKKQQPRLPQKSQELKTKTRQESIIVAGVTMFKDEEDIAYHNLVWHYNQGIQRFVVLDNMSSDNTPQEVKRFADDYPEAQVYLIEDPEVGYYQSRKMTAVAEFAYKMWGAEWILPFDADEILCSFRGPLHTVLESIPREHICIQLPYKVHMLRSFYDDSEPNPFKRITHRQKGDLNKGAKVIIRWQSGMVIGQGNHSVSINNNLLPITKNQSLGLSLRHYPFRSKEHIRQKVIKGGKAYTAANDLPKKYGASWRKWDKQYQTQGEKYIEEMYNSQVEGYPDTIYDPAII